MSTETHKDIKTLDREAREALDRLADKREELAREHRGTELAAERQKEREEERLSQERREAEEREQERLRKEAREMGARRLALEIRGEKEAEALADTLQELLALDPGHVGAVRAAYGKAPEQRYSQSFSRMLGGWFRAHFNKLVPGIGFDSWEGDPPPKERDTLTPAQEGGGG